MSDAKAQSRQRAIDHMVRLLQMNPIHQGEEIVAARVDALGLAMKAADGRPVPAAEHRVDRRQMLDQLESIRSQFWALPPDALSSQLDAFDSGNFVDLEVAINRLRVVAAHRDQFPALAGKSGFDGDFFSSLKEILIRSPRDTAVAREQVLSTFRYRSRRSKQGRKMVELLRTEMPAIYDLEADWFNTLCRQKSQSPKLMLTSKSRPADAVVSADSNLRKYWWLIWFGLVVVGRLATSLTNSGSTQTPGVPNIRFPDVVRQSPSDLQRDFQKAMRSREDSFSNQDKEVWKPYESPHSSDSGGQTDSRPSTDGDSFPDPIFLHRPTPR